MARSIHFLIMCILAGFVLVACRGKEESTPDAATNTVDVSSAPTEAVDSATFCSDQRPLEIIEAVKDAVRNRDGQKLASLISPDGLYMSRYPSTQPVHLTSAEVHNFFNDTTIRDWGTNAFSGTSIEESLAGDITAHLDENLLAANATVACNNNQDGLSDGLTLYSIDYPVDNYYSVQRPADDQGMWRSWGFGFEYRNGQPLLTVLSFYPWTP